MRSRHAAALALLAGLALAGCGAGSRAHAPAATRGAGTIRMALSGVPTLDPARATTAQETELDWVLYTGLVTYRHARGQAGTQLIPGVASALPRVSNGGRLYTVTLRHGLRFWSGRRLRASDVADTIERTLHTRDSPVRPLLIGVLSGAAAFAAGRATSISGITADDASGRVTIRLRRRDAAFDALLAEPALGIVPAGTQVSERPAHPPPGIGPYRLRAVHAGHSFTLARNPDWTALPGIPAGQVDVDVILSRDARGSALAALNGVLDVEDPAQTLAPGMLEQIRHEGAGRVVQVPSGHPFADLFLDTTVPPFDDRLAREAVVAGLGAQTLTRAAARSLSSACDVVPVVTGAPTPAGCPAPPAASGELATARTLVTRSGTAGAPVTVWAPRTGVARGWMDAEAAVLRAIGYAARVVTIPDGTYRAELATLVPRPAPAGPSAHLSSRIRPQLASRSLRSPGPATVAADAVVEGSPSATVHVPAAGVVTVAVGPEVVLRNARRTHRVVFGQPVIPELMSWRMDESAAVIDPVEGLDFTSLRLR
jgi:peptide/nickel transport system substrate-binding protein